MAISFPPIPQFVMPNFQPTTRPTNPLSQLASDPQDTVSLGNGLGEFPQFPKPGTFGPIAAAPAAPEKPQSMAELDQQAAECIDQGTQAILDLREKTPTPPGGGGMITNFHQQAQDQQSMISDMKAAQAIQRQTQLALRDKKAPDNKLTQAAMARRSSALKEKFSSGKQFNLTGPISNFSSQAFDHQKQILAKAEKEGWPDYSKPKPTTQPAFPTGALGWF